jgi:hypothetical protein
VSPRQSPHRSIGASCSEVDLTYDLCSYQAPGIDEVDRMGILVWDDPTQRLLTATFDHD